MEICRSGSISKNHQLSNLNKCGKLHACIRNSTIFDLSRLAIIPIIRVGGQIAKLSTHFVCFKDVCVFNLCQFLLHTYLVQKETIGKSKNGRKMQYNVLVCILDLKLIS